MSSVERDSRWQLATEWHCTGFYQEELSYAAWQKLLDAAEAVLQEQKPIVRKLYAEKWNEV